MTVRQTRNHFLVITNSVFFRINYPVIGILHYAQLVKFRFLNIIYDIPVYPIDIPIQVVVIHGGPKTLEFLGEIFFPGYGITVFVIPGAFQIDFGPAGRQGYAKKQYQYSR
jgi:hypothetical protein